jgi:hypothetical protein
MTPTTTVGGKGIYRATTPKVGTYFLNYRRFRHGGM